MSKRYTDFSQLPKGMFKGSEAKLEQKPEQDTKVNNDDDEVLIYFGLKAPRATSNLPPFRTCIRAERAKSLAQGVATGKTGERLALWRGIARALAVFK